jgi:hypothetical protein
MVKERKLTDLAKKEWMLPIEFAELLGIHRSVVSQNLNNERYETKMLGSKVYIKNTQANKEIHPKAMKR